VPSSRLRIVDGTPAVLENRFIPVEIAERMSIEDLRQRPMYDILEMSVGRPVARVDGIINAVAAVPDVAKILRIAQGTPILVRDYTLADRGGAPLVCGETSYRTQYPIRYTVVQSSNG
jgi:GntR family transcriptional regulator